MANRNRTCHICQIPTVHRAKIHRHEISVVIIRFVANPCGSELFSPDATIKLKFRSSELLCQHHADLLRDIQLRQTRTDKATDMRKYMVRDSLCLPVAGDLFLILLHAERLDQLV